MQRGPYWIRTSDSQITYHYNFRYQVTLFVVWTFSLSSPLRGQIPILKSLHLPILLGLARDRHSIAALVFPEFGRFYIQDFSYTLPLTVCCSTAELRSQVNKEQYSSRENRTLISRMKTWRPNR